MPPSKVLFFCCLAFLIGIFFASFFKVKPFFLIFLFIFFFRKNPLILLLILIFFFFGYFNFQQKIKKLEVAKNFFFEKEKREILGVLVSQPEKKEKFQDFILKIKNLNGKEGFFGKALVRVPLFEDLKYGDEVKIFGKISKPKNDYLLKDEILAIFYFPKIEKTGKNFGNFLLKFVFNFREKLEKEIEKIFPLPHSGVIEALLFGKETKIPKEIKEKLNLTNTRHITAVSGMNLTIISFLVLNFLLSVGLWRKQAFYLTIFFIGFYLLMIGLPSSGVRAAIMAFFLLTAQYFGRLSESSRTVYFSAFLMLLFNPLLLKYDFGFQLSFLATLGLVYLYPIFLKIFKDAPKIFGFKENLAATLSAQIFVLPLLLYNFKKFSPIFIFPNILILPILPLTTVLGFFCPILSFFYFPLGKFFSFSALFFTSYLLKVVDFFSKFPYFTFERFSLIFLIFSYFLLAILTFFLNRKFSQPYFLK